MIPNELPGRANLVIFGFVQDHQDKINTWIPRCEELERQFDGFSFFEVPFLAGKYKLIRFWIDGGMRRGIPQSSARERTITVYGGRHEAMKKLGITDLSNIYAILTTPAGEIIWSADGEWTIEKDSELKRFLSKRLWIE